MKNILAADIGGTHSRFGHFTLDEEGELSIVGSIWLSTAEASSLPELFCNLREGPFSLRPEDADLAVIAVAGPVEDRVRSRPPLIAWDVDISDSGRALGLKRCSLINDFIAQAFACRSPLGDTAEEILRGSSVADAPAAVVGAGTGLGKAVTISDGKGGYLALPSEGGHTNFPFVSAGEFEYQTFLFRERKEHYITSNTVVSGRGLSYLHQFLTGQKLEPSEVVREFDRSPETLQWASRFYARVCRNYVLETLAMGGLYVAGGVAAKASELLRHKAFEKEFRSSDTLPHLLAKVPVSLIRDENSGLWGAAVFARQELRITIP
jgi:glucokinase